jgi:hypothetical protein
MSSSECRLRVNSRNCPPALLHQRENLRAQIMPVARVNAQR